VRSEPSPEDLFECQQCGQCCCGYGGTYLDRTDIVNISSYLGVARDLFLSRYCTPSAGRWMLAQNDDGFCVFWDRVCTIHSVKPRMCRAWPFIENILHNPSAWDVMAEACPGMRTGFDKNDVLRCVDEKLEELGRIRSQPPQNPDPGESS
jgi:Fe-S-cluster containining protein